MTVRGWSATVVKLPQCSKARATRPARAMRQRRLHARCNSVRRRIWPRAHIGAHQTPPGISRWTQWSIAQPGSKPRATPRLVLIGQSLQAVRRRTRAASAFTRASFAWHNISSTVVRPFMRNRFCVDSFLKLLSLRCNLFITHCHYGCALYCGYAFSPLTSHFSPLRRRRRLTHRRSTNPRQFEKGSTRGPCACAREDNDLRHKVRPARALSLSDVLQLSAPLSLFLR